MNTMNLTCRQGACGHSGPCSNCQVPVQQGTVFTHPQTKQDGHPRCECHSCTQYRASQTPFYTGPKPE